MSDKGLLFKKRKNNHGSHNRCSQGSGFPRRDMDKFPGTHLGMKLRYQKASVGRLIEGWNINRGYLRTNRITGFIDKFIGKPYNDLVKAFYVLIKDLRNSHKEVGLADLEWHFEQFRYRRWRGDYYVDDDGLVQVVKPELDRKQTSHINKQQVAYNKKVKIPDFGRVSVPRKVDSSKTRCWDKYGFPDREFIHYEKCQYHAPRFLGNYWCDMDGKMLFYLFIMFQALTSTLNIGQILMEFLNLEQVDITTALILRNGTIVDIVIGLQTSIDQALMNISGRKV